MEALRIIKDEHRNLWRIAITLDRIIEDMKTDGKVDAIFLGSVFDYFEQYVDDCHHPKEDDYLFRLLRQRSLDAAAVLDRLEAEHRSAPANLKGLRDKLARAASGQLPVADLAEALADQEILLVRDVLACGAACVARSGVMMCCMAGFFHGGRKKPGTCPSMDVRGPPSRGLGKEWTGRRRARPDIRDEVRARSTRIRVHGGTPF